VARSSRTCTLSIFAATAWIFGSSEVPRLLRDGSIVSVALYVVAFWADVAALRPVAGSLMLAAMVWFMVWAFGARRGHAMTVPRLSMLLAMVNLVIGGVLGVLLGLKLAGALTWLPAGMAAAHPAMMVVGYLILAGFAIDEQLLGGPGTESLPRSGQVQAWLFFLAGIALAVGLMFDVLPLLMVNLLFEVIGVGLVLTRNRRAIVGAGWGSPSPERFAAVSLLFGVVALSLLAYMIVTYGEDPDAIPLGLLVALDHATFVGILTNAIFGLLLVATLRARETLWPWSDPVVFWGLNVGVAAFTVALIAESTPLKRIATPVLGAAILLGLLATALRARTTPAPEPQR
jgi:hypothetical protein